MGREGKERDGYVEHYWLHYCHSSAYVSVHIKSHQLLVRCYDALNLYSHSMLCSQQFTQRTVLSDNKITWTGSTHYGRLITLCPRIHRFCDAGQKSRDRHNDMTDSLMPDENVTQPSMTIYRVSVILYVHWSRLSDDERQSLGKRPADVHVWRFAIIRFCSLAYTQWTIKNVTFYFWL